MTTSDFHAKAKDAGNRLSGYVLNYSASASGLFFWSLVQESATHFSIAQKMAIVTALVLYVATVIMRLLELHFDAKRFYECAIQNAKEVYMQDWTRYNQGKKTRLYLIFASYFSVALATLAAMVFMVLRLI